LVDQASAVFINFLLIFLKSQHLRVMYQITVLKTETEFTESRLATMVVHAVEINRAAMFKQAMGYKDNVIIKQ